MPQKFRGLKPPFFDGSQNTSSRGHSHIKELSFSPQDRSMRLALFQPDIPQNAATLIRTAACLGVPLDIIEPCGFVLSDARFRRAGMDYLAQAALIRHESWERFLAAKTGRLVLLTTRSALAYTDFAFADGDSLLLGRESAGVPDFVHDAAEARITVPMRPGLRSLNVAIAGSMVLGEALRQMKSFPSPMNAQPS